MTRIREATDEDREALRAVHLRAFPEGERQMVAGLAVDLLSETTSPATINLAAEIDGAVVGHVAFSPITIGDNGDWRGSILAPLGVVPEYQHRGIGSELVRSGIDRLSQQGVHVLFVYGDPEYYGKFGFDAEAASRYSPPFELQYPIGWQAIVLNETGRESTGQITCVASLNDPDLW